MEVLLAAAGSAAAELLAVPVAPGTSVSMAAAPVLFALLAAGPAGATAGWMAAVVAAWTGSGGSDFWSRAVRLTAGVAFGTAVWGVVWRNTAAAATAMTVGMVLGDAAVLCVRHGARVSRALQAALRRLPVLAAGPGLGIGLVWLREEFGPLGFVLGFLTVLMGLEPFRVSGEQVVLLRGGMRVIAGAVDAKDPDTASHSERVAALAVRLARAVGLPEDEVEAVAAAALLHDAGKVAVDARILRKPAGLSPEEWEVVRAHPVVGQEILSGIPGMDRIARVIRHHHERWDGGGYPDGLKGEQIPLHSRIIHLADAYDAMTSDRAYRKGKSRDEALEIILREAGRQFDPVLAREFASMLQRGGADRG